MAQPRAFSFFRAGGFDQVRFESGKDVVELGQLDKKLWVALACPTKGLALDQRTLELVDAAKDGRIRVDELADAAKWTGGLLKNADDLMQAPATLPLSAIDERTDAGKAVLAAAKMMLDSLDKPQATELAKDDIGKAREAFNKKPFNGDGVIIVAAAPGDTEKKLLEDVLAHSEPVADASGAMGVDKARIDAFFKNVKDAAAWLKDGEGAEVQPAGEGTAAAFDALTAVRARVDDYFTRCRLAAFDERAAGAMNRDEKDFVAFAAKELTLGTDELKALPLAKVGAGKALPLESGVNPAWAAALATLREKAVTPLLGERAQLTEAEWNSLNDKLAAHGAWRAKKAGGTVSALGRERVEALAQEGARAPLDALLAKDLELAQTAKALADVEKLFHFRRDLHELANNFVAFRDFYERKTPALFQAGTLFLDQRAYELCLPVEDAGKHAALAPLSRMFLAYCDCARPATGEKRSIVAAVTAGDGDNLMVGRNGVFYDRDGKDWDATITKLVDNPISIRQAFWSPYKKLVRFVEEQVAKRAAAGEEASHAGLTGSVKGVEKAADTGKADGVMPKKLDVGVVAALGVAVGGITAALGALLDAFFGLGWWMPVGLVALVLLISGPSMLIAWLKLRQRNLGPVLDANGWAVNARARISLPLGASLTRLPSLPSGSRVDTMDPFAEKRRPWGVYFTLGVLLVLGGLWYLGKVDRFLPPAARSTRVLGANAPVGLAPHDAKPAADTPAAQAPPTAPTPAAP